MRSFKDRAFILNFESADHLLLPKKFWYLDLRYHKEWNNISPIHSPEMINIFQNTKFKKNRRTISHSIKGNVIQNYDSCWRGSQKGWTQFTQEWLDLYDDASSSNQSVYSSSLPLWIFRQLYSFTLRNIGLCEIWS